MNVGQTQNTTLAFPSCFGSNEHYDPRNAECRGGVDPKYTDPRTGGHVRPACDVFNQCGSRVAQKASQIIPVRNLTQPSGIPLGPPSPAPPQGQGTSLNDFIAQQKAAAAAMQQVTPHAQQQAAWAEHYRQQQLAQQLQQRPAPPPQYYQPPYPPMAPPPPPQQHYGGQYQLNYMMPAYLSVPEARHPGQSIWAILGRESIRAIGKSFGHTIAHFFDMNPFRLPPEQ